MNLACYFILLDQFSTTEEKFLISFKQFVLVVGYQSPFISQSPKLISFLI